MESDELDEVFINEYVKKSIRANVKDKIDLEDKKLKAQLAVVNMFKRSLMKYAKRVAKEEAKKLKAEQKAKKICKSL